MSVVKNEKELLNGDVPPKEAGLFGIIGEIEKSELVIIPVEWDATASYGQGASSGPSGILEASHQLDLEDLCFSRPYSKGISMLPLDGEIKKLNLDIVSVVSEVRAAFEKNTNCSKQIKIVNNQSSKVNDFVYHYAKRWLDKGKKVAVLGGDHSCPYGLIKALNEKYDSFSILHFDAHFDFRDSFEGFKWSHASIMKNSMDDFLNINKIVQIGIRDFCNPELKYAKELNERCVVYYSRDIFRKKQEPLSFGSITKEILNQLSDKIYISFDIDGLDPTHCPATGTPVPGGLSYDEALYILEELGMDSSKEIIGFDLCEVVNKPEMTGMDCNVGARILYKLCGATLEK